MFSITDHMSYSRATEKRTLWSASIASPRRSRVTPPHGPADTGHNHWPSALPCVTIRLEGQPCDAKSPATMPRCSRLLHPRLPLLLTRQPLLGEAGRCRRRAGAGAPRAATACHACPAPMPGLARPLGQWAPSPVRCAAGDLASGHSQGGTGAGGGARARDGPGCRRRGTRFSARGCGRSRRGAMRGTPTRLVVQKKRGQGH